MSFNNSLACEICLEEYTLQLHTPHILRECGHTYCSPCLKKLLTLHQNRINCPKCRKPTYGTTISDFAMNSEYVAQISGSRVKFQNEKNNMEFSQNLVKHVPLTTENYYEFESSWSHQDIYNGEWKNGTLNGYGEYHFAVGGIYKGEWKDGFMNGKGEYSYKDNSSYKGGWKQGRKEGYGEFYHVNGETYIGEWKNGNMEGKGGYFYHDGSRYVGEWKNGKKHGNGTFFFSDGGLYSGEWRDGLPCDNSKGSLYFSYKNLSFKKDVDRVC